MSQLIKKKHDGRIWSITPCTDVYNIYVQDSKMNEQDGDYSQNDNDVHRLIFHLPIKYLRSGATSICEFKKNNIVLPFVDAFCFYLNFIEELYINGEKNSVKREQIKLFLEDVRNTKGHKVALRFHLFIQCKDSALKEIKKYILEQHGKLIRKRKRSASNKQHEMYENYKEIYDDFTWSKMVATYKMKSDCMDIAYNMYNDEVGDNHELETQMNGVFGVDTELFKGIILNSNNQPEDCDICDLQKNFHYYSRHDVKVSTTQEYNGEKYNCYVFPVEKDVVMVHPTEVFIKEIFKKRKYLPSYMREKILLPKVEVECTDDNTYSMDGSYDAKFKVPKNHINTLVKFIEHNCKQLDITEYLHEFCELCDSSTNFLIYKHSGGVSEKNMIKQKLKDFFQVCELVDEDQSDFVCFKGNKSFYSYKRRYKHVSLSYINLFAHNGKTFIDDPIERAALTDKNTLDTLDFLKYETNILKKRYSGDKLQKLLFDKFKNDVVDNPYAMVSDPLRVILDWGIEHKTHHIKRKKYKDWNNENGMWKHENIFINSMNWKMDVFDNDLQVATGHSSLMMLHHGKYDAYRQTMDLHLNIIFTGEGATSKSFLFEKMRQMSIPATVVELTYQTSKADAIDGDRNDTITVFNEAPAGLFMTNKHSDPGDEARFKEKLTSQRVSCKTYEKDDETGLRTNRTTISQSIGVNLGATNDDPADASEAMRTRFYWGQFEKSERKNKSMDACMQGEKIWKEIGEDLLEHTMNDFHMEHYRMALLFKLMYIGAISYPTLTTSDIVFMRMSAKLRQMKLNTSTRFKERFDILCRIYTMTKALDLIFNYETSEFKACKCNFTDEDGDRCMENAVFYKTGEKKASLCLEHGILDTYEVIENSNKDCCIEGCTEEAIFFGEHDLCMKHRNHVVKGCVDKSNFGECGIRCQFENCENVAQYMFIGQNKPSHCIDHRQEDMILFGNHCGMDFDVRQLRDVEPHLFCTEEIAVFVFTQLSLEVCNPSENKVINAMYQLWKQKGSKYKKDDQANIDYNVSTLKIGYVNQLVKMISTNIPIQYGRPSDHNIKMVLKELGTRNICHVPYVAPSNLIHPFTTGDHGSTYKQIIKNTNEVCFDKKITTDCFNIIDREIHISTEIFKNIRLKEGRLKSMENNNQQQSMEMDKYDDSGYPTEDEPMLLPPLMLEMDKSDVLNEAVNAIQHSFTKEKYVMFGLPHRDEHGTINKPNKFHLKKIVPNNQPIQMKNPIFKTNESLVRRQRTDIMQQEQNVGENILMDLNLYASISHSEKLKPPQKKVFYRNKKKMDDKNKKIEEKNKENKNMFLKIYGSVEKKYKYVDKPLVFVNENASYIDKRLN